MMAIFREISCYSSGEDIIEQIASSECGTIRSQQILFETRELREPKSKARVIAQCSQISEMIGQTLVFERQGTQIRCAWRARCLADCFQSAATGPRQRNARIAG